MSLFASSNKYITIEWKEPKWRERSRPCAQVKREEEEVRILSCSLSTYRSVRYQVGKTIQDRMRHSRLMGGKAMTTKQSRGLDTKKTTILSLSGDHQLGTKMILDKTEKDNAKRRRQLLLFWVCWGFFFDLSPRLRFPARTVGDAKADRYR